MPLKSNRERQLASELEKLHRENAFLGLTSTVAGAIPGIGTAVSIGADLKRDRGRTRQLRIVQEIFSVPGRARQVALYTKDPQLRKWLLEQSQRKIMMRRTNSIRGSLSLRKPATVSSKNNKTTRSVTPIKKVT